LTAVFVALRLARSRERLAIQREGERIDSAMRWQIERDKLEQQVRTAPMSSRCWRPTCKPCAKTNAAAGARAAR